MRKPSRHMLKRNVRTVTPRLPTRLIQLGIRFLFFTAMLGAWGLLLWKFPIATGLLILLVGSAGFVQFKIEKRAFKRLAAQRKGESICTFTRALPYRSLDTWVIRAVYEQLQDFLHAQCPDFPLRPSDRLGDLRLDSDDLEDELAAAIACRSGRLLIDPTRNPYYGNIKTVADLVRYFCSQPKSAHS